MRKRKPKKKISLCKTLNEAFETAENIIQLPMRSRAFDEIAVRFAEAGDLQKGAALLFESLQTVQMILDQSLQASELANLALAHEKIGVGISDRERDILCLTVRKIG